MSWITYFPVEGKEMAPIILALCWKPNTKHEIGLMLFSLIFWDNPSRKYTQGEIKGSCSFWEFVVVQLLQRNVGMCPQRFLAEGRFNSIGGAEREEVPNVEKPEGELRGAMSVPTALLLPPLGHLCSVGTWAPTSHHTHSFSPLLSVSHSSSTGLPLSWETKLG